MNKELTPKQKEGQDIIDRMDKYLEQLCESNVAYTKLKERQIAIYGCKMIIRDHFKLKQEQEIMV